MSEKTPRTLNHFAFYRFRDRYWELSTGRREAFQQSWLDGLREVARNLDIYQVFPVESSADILVWSAITAEETDEAAEFFERYARVTNPHRALVEPTAALWGYTRPSQYTKTRSTQEIDPFAETRKPYLVLYPFVKTADWYMTSRDARQGMMNEHIRIGKQYPEITQLLLYSFGLQDQEFIVVYETDDLVMFSDLVTVLRGSEARRYTERDTPLYTAIYHSAAETLALWS